MFVRKKKDIYNSKRLPIKDLLDLKNFPEVPYFFHKRLFHVTQQQL